MIYDENADKLMMRCLYKAQDIVEEICLNPCEYCYDLKHLDINGHDLKKIGVPDVELGHYLNGLLQLVVTEAVENNNEKLIEVARISRF
jgi:predicted DNA-binding helix-hairpin-helix protein